MSGSNVDAYSDRGINYRALDDLFQLNRERHAEVGGGWVVQMVAAALRVDRQGRCC